MLLHMWSLESKRRRERGRGGGGGAAAIRLRTAANCSDLQCRMSDGRQPQGCHSVAFGMRGGGGGGGGGHTVKQIESACEAAPQGVYSLYAAKQVCIHICISQPAAAWLLIRLINKLPSGHLDLSCRFEPTIIEPEGASLASLATTPTLPSRTCHHIPLCCNGGPLMVHICSKCC